MRKTLLFSMLFLLICSTSIAQFTVADEDGNTIPDGSVITTNSTARRSATWDFLVVNNNATDIYIKAELVSTTGDPSQFEFCFGLCYSGISVNQVLPPTDPVTVAANSDSGRGNHMLNMAASQGAIFDYQMRFYQTDVTGNTELGPEWFITYRYDMNATLSFDSEVKLSASVLNTVVSGSDLNLDVQEAVDFTLYDLQGRLLMSDRLETGMKTINISSLKSQTFILQLKNDTGAVLTKKIVKK